MKRIFDRLKDGVKQQRKHRQIVLTIFKNLRSKYLEAAFTKWNLGYFRSDSSQQDAFSGNGSIALQKAYEDRELVQVELRDMIADTVNIHKTLQFTKYTRRQRNNLLQSSYLSGENHI